jgi:Zn-dependent protease with chaperone function
MTVMQGVVAKALRPIAAVAVLSGLAGPAGAGCNHLDGPLAGALRARIPAGSANLPADMAPRVEALRPVYERLAEVSGIRPALLVCDDRIFNAMAIGPREQGAVVFYLPLVRFLDGRTDEIAAVMAHEFAHLVLDHARQNEAAAREITRSAQKVANDRYRRTGNVSAAVEQARQFGQIEVARYSRFHEREADEKGFSLAVTLGGYSGEGGKNLALALSKLPATARPAYLETHPGWVERFSKADVLTINQDYLNQAAALYAGRRWRDLAQLVDRWLAAVPDSGAAWYYKGRLILRKPASPSAITRTFEQSLARYMDNETLGTRSQEDQAERDDAWYSLCSALFDEGYRRESIACSKYILDSAKRERFRIRNFGEHHQLITSTDSPPPDLFLARNPDGGKLITNDAGVAASRGDFATAAPQWRAQRFP